MRKWIGLCVVLAGCADSSTAPTSPVAPSSTMVITDAPAPKAVGDETSVVSIHVVDWCTKGPIVNVPDPSRNAHPITISFSNGQRVQTGTDDATITLPYGTFGWESVTAVGYNDNGRTRGTLVVDEPTEFLPIEQLRLCGGPVVPPPQPPPPQPPPPVPPPPVPPPPPQTCQQVHPPSYSNLRWDNTVSGSPIAASVDVSNEGTWVLAIYASIDGGNWIYKLSDSVQTACGTSAHLRHEYHWDGHPAQRWIYVFNGPNGISVTSPVFTRP